MDSPSALSQLEQNPVEGDFDRELEELRTGNQRLVESLQQLQRERAGDSLEAVLTAIDRAIDGTLGSVEALQQTRARLILGVTSVADRLAEIEGAHPAGAHDSEKPVPAGAPPPAIVPVESRGETPPPAVVAAPAQAPESIPITAHVRTVPDPAPAAPTAPSTEPAITTEPTLAEDTGSPVTASPAVSVPVAPEPPPGPPEPTEVPVEAPAAVEAEPAPDAPPAAAPVDAAATPTAPPDDPAEVPPAPAAEPSDPTALDTPAGAPLAGQVDLVVHRCSTFSLVNKLQAELSALSMVERLRVRLFRHSSLHLTITYVGESLEEVVAQLEVDGRRLEVVEATPQRIEATFPEGDGG